MAGILHHYAALLNFLAPTHNSMRRLIPDFSSGCYNCWGIENKEAPIRLIGPLKPGDVPSHFEVKSMDHTANQYIGLAAVVVAGIEGLKNGLKLSPPIQGDPSSLSEQERQNLGISLLPNTFEDRKNALMSMQGKPLRNFFGEDMINNLLAIQKCDFDYLADKTLEEEVKILIDKY